MKLTRNHSTTAASRRAAIVAAVALGIATCASAMSLRLEVPAQAVAAVVIGHESAGAPISSAESRALWARTAAYAQVRISGGVAAGQIVSKVAPVYPQEAKEQGIQGAVVLHAIIGADGTVKELAVISGPPELTASAMEAVRQWVYKPYLLNGEPTAVDTTITVNYFLGEPSQHPPSPPPQLQADNASEDAYQITAADGQVYNVGGSVHAPVLTYAPHPEYTETARKAKLSGNVIVGLLVDPAGEPQNVRVVRGLGNELDEKAVEAVQQYKFKPATRNGEPVAANLKVEVNFQIF